MRVYAPGESGVADSILCTCPCCLTSTVGVNASIIIAWLRLVVISAVHILQLRLVCYHCTITMMLSGNLCSRVVLFDMFPNIVFYFPLHATGFSWACCCAHTVMYERCTRYPSLPNLNAPNGLYDFCQRSAQIVHQCTSKQTGSTQFFFSWIGPLWQSLLLKGLSSKNESYVILVVFLLSSCLLLGVCWCTSDNSFCTFQPSICSFTFFFLTPAAEACELCLVSKSGFGRLHKRCKGISKLRNGVVRKSALLHTGKHARECVWFWIYVNMACTVVEEEKS